MLQWQRMTTSAEASLMRSRQQSTWTELPHGSAEASYWKVSCRIPGCSFEDVKATPRNVRLCMKGHMRRHAGQSADFSVVPMRREEVGR